MKVKKITALFLALSIMMGMFFVSSVYAEEAVAKIGGTSYATLDEALNAATDGDTIVLSGNTSITEEITVKGNGVTLDGANNKVTVNSATASILVDKGAKLEVKNITFTSNGAIATSRSETEVRVFRAEGELVLSDNAVIDGAGGAVKVGAGKCIMASDTTAIRNCRSKGFGGAAIIDGGGEFVLDKGVIEGCSNADGYWPGGAVTIMWSYPSRFTMNGGIIRNCSHSKGGAIGGYQGAIVTINGGTIENCSANTKGGAVFLAGDGAPSKFYMTGGSIVGCKQMSRGAVWVNSDCEKKVTGAAYIEGGDIGYINPLYIEGKEYWQAEIKGESASMIVDNDVDSMWHSAYRTNAKGEIIEKENPPFYFMVTLPEATEISGFVYTPRQDNLTGVAQYYEIFVSEGGTNVTDKIFEGELAVTHDIKTVKFGFTVKAKVFVFAIVEGASGFGTIAELDLLKPDGTEVKSIESIATGKRYNFLENKVIGKDSRSNSIYLDGKDGWKIIGGTGYKSDGLEILLDGKKSTWWHSAYTTNEAGEIIWHDEPPFDFEIILPEATYFSGFSTMPRTSNATGWITEWEFYAAESDEDDYVLIHEGTYPSVPTEKIFNFSQNVKAKKIKFVAKDALAGFFVLAEFDLLKPLDTLKNAESIASYIVDYEALKPIKMDPVRFKATASDLGGDFSGPANVIDGKPGPAWHTSAEVVGDYPYTLEIDLGSISEITKFVYVPRTDDSTSVNGIWKNYDLEVSDTGEEGSYVKVLESKGFEENHTSQEVKLMEPVKGRYFRFVIHEGVGGYATCGELEFYETNRGNKERKDNNRWILTVDSNEVEVIKDGKSTKVTMDVAPYIDGGYTQIPLRGLLEDMGAEITWDGNHRKVIIDYGTKRLELQIMNHRVYVKDEKFGEVRYSLAVPPKIKDSRTFVPLRFISEHLGYTVEWNGEDRTITIY